MDSIIINHKPCPHCKEDKPTGDYGKPKAPYAICKACRVAINGRERPRQNFHLSVRRVNYLKSTYGLVGKDYEGMYRAQKGRCAICRKKSKVKLKDESAKVDLHVDHNHATGAVRALLCNHCNTGLGMFLENPSILQAAIEYLQRFHVSPSPGAAQSSSLDAP